MVESYVFRLGAATKLTASNYCTPAQIANIAVVEAQRQLMVALRLPKADLVTLLHVIERVPKGAGMEMLEKSDQPSDRYASIDTPNGFVSQGPEYGNPYQRHPSGWYPHDFEGHDYQVHGSLGTKNVRGYMIEPRVSIPGTRLFDNVVHSRLLMMRHFAHHAFNITAIKDLRGVPVRYNSYDDPSRV